MKWESQFISLCNVCKYESFFSWKFITSGLPLLWFVGYIYVINHTEPQLQWWLLFKTCTTKNFLCHCVKLFISKFLVWNGNYMYKMWTRDWSLFIMKCHMCVFSRLTEYTCTFLAWTALKNKSQMSIWLDCNEGRLCTKLKACQSCEMGN